MRFRQAWLVMLGASGLLTFSAVGADAGDARRPLVVAESAAWGGVVHPRGPNGSYWRRTFEGWRLLQSPDGGWAIAEFTDAGLTLIPVRAPRGYFEPQPDGGWAAVEFLADGGLRKMSIFEPPGGGLDLSQ